MPARLHAPLDSVVKDDAKSADENAREGAASDTPPAAEVLREHRTNPLVREMFDKAAASEPSWWIQRAIALTKEVPDPLTRASLWLRVASAEAEVGDLAGYRTSMEQARYMQLPPGRRCSLTGGNRKRLSAPGS